VRNLIWIILLLSARLSAAPTSQRVKAIDVAPVWSGHPVAFALLTRGQKQFVGFYDAQRRMTIGARKLDSEKWSFKVLPTSVGWDSHNYVTMAFDDDDQLHVAGNMHAAPLVYFRTAKPLDIDSLQRVPAMVGKNEEHCTYPRFLRGPANEFIFAYRDGHSGDGNDIYNVYDRATRTWSRLLDEPLTDGQGLMNAYFQGPMRGPDGWLHLCGVWRDSPGCQSNHDLSYARSKDLRHWEKADGTPLKLPLRVDNIDVVDPVPPGGGIINGNTKIGFDSRRRVIISYHKFDPAGKTQAYNARLEDGKWKIYQTSDWDYRWEFGGGGSIHFEVTLGAVRTGAKPGTLTQTFSHDRCGGSGVWTLDEATLKPIATSKPAPSHPPELDRVESKFAGMEVRWAGDAGRPLENNTRYELRWETLGINRDKPRPQPWPEPTMLRLYQFTTDG
jgi:hypothetical protein